MRVSRDGFGAKITATNLFADAQILPSHKYVKLSKGL